MTTLDTVSSVTEPAFSIDPNAVILAWNEGAERLFGYKAAAVLGRRCWDVLSGRDMFGNQYCGEACPLISMARRHRAISRCELCFRGAADQSICTGVSTMVVPGSSGADMTIVHLFTPLGPEPASPDKLAAIERPTAREIEVLRLLSDGKRTGHIATQLKVTEATVRNHIQQILHKLNAHSRLEAVCVAWRLGLIENLNDNANC
jgi:DNA-binding CsgD family transcriptional regulator